MTCTPATDSARAMFSGDYLTTKGEVASRDIAEFKTRVLDGKTLEAIPLVADRSIGKANPFVSASDFIARAILSKRR